MKNKKNKSLGTTIMWLMLMVGLIPLLVSGFGSYHSLRNHLIERNNFSKQGAVDLLQEERAHLQNSTAKTIKKAAKDASFKSGNMDSKTLKATAQAMLNTNAAITSTMVGNSN